MNLIQHALELFLPIRAFAAENYQLLTPLPNFSGSFSDAARFSNYLQAIFDIGISVAIGLAVLVMIWGGFQYLSTDAFYGKTEGKGKLTRALGGLLIALGIVIFINTVNPNLRNLNLTLSPLSPIRPVELPGGPIVDDPLETQCNNCIKFPSDSVPIKGAGACDVARLNQAGLGTYCRINSTLAGRLTLLTQRLDGANILKQWWEVTEAWPPTVVHKSVCHRDGTCVDAVLRSNATNSNIDKFCQTVKDNGLGPILYEVQSEAAYLDLRDKLPHCTVLNTGASPHFHFPNSGGTTSGNGD